MSRSHKFPPFEVASDDPLAAEHTAVSAWVEAATKALGKDGHYRDLDLKSIPSGQALLAGDSEQSRQIVLAAVIQMRHWDQCSLRIQREAETTAERSKPQLSLNWNQAWGRLRQAAAVIHALTRRKLPFRRDDLLALLELCSDAESLASSCAPAGQIARALERYASVNPIDAELCERMKLFALLLRSAYTKDTKRLGTVVEQLCLKGEPEPSLPSAPLRPVAGPAPAGAPHVLGALKRLLGMIPTEPAPTATMLEPDLFAMDVDSPFHAEHGMLSSMFSEVVGTHHYHDPNLQDFAAGKRLLSLEPAGMGAALLAAAERHVNSILPLQIEMPAHAIWQSRYAAAGVAMSLLNCDFELNRTGNFDLLLYLSILPASLRPNIDAVIGKSIAAARVHAEESPLTEGERYVLSLFRASLISGPLLGKPTEEVVALSGLINDGAMFYLVPGETWTEKANRDISACGSAARTQWAGFLQHALTATAARPSSKWLKTAGQLIQTLGGDVIRQALSEWFPLVAQGHTIRKFARYAGDSRGTSEVMHEENANCLRGLLWCVPLLPQRDELARSVTAVALTAYKKVPGVGPRAVKVGNAAIYVLSELASKEAVGQLAMLKVRVRFGTAQKEIEKAFEAAATALSLPRDQIEELGVPSYGLEGVGYLTEKFGTYRAELNVTGSSGELKWFDGAGKSLKSVPAKVKSEFKDELKDLQQSLKDIQLMLPAQRHRIDGLFLLQKSWPIAEWRDRYLDHPLVGTIARRLLWCIDGISACFINGEPVDSQGSPIVHGKTAEITPWHPLERSLEEVLAWRRQLEALGITQPFKQAYREVYLLTDAERNTRTYSNRFAAHIIRQHQFHSLCAARGWKNQLRLMVDDFYPPATKELPNWGLRAEFWIEGIGQDYGADTNDAGTYLRLVTDQVRFYRAESVTNSAHASGGGYGSSAIGEDGSNVNEPLPLEDVPPLVFSEVMRDIDLFVGVASVGNDPTWQDGGPRGQFRDYWHGYSFGELSGSAATRKQVLERLVPRLKIAPRCSFSDRFLVVRGDKRTYKIHLGSSNILMEPNNQYLCIVPNSSARTAQENLYLPFEGDQILSVIISKALLLAEDTKIKDPTITRQIDGF